MGKSKYFKFGQNQQDKYNMFILQRIDSIQIQQNIDVGKNILTLKL